MMLERMTLERELGELGIGDRQAPRQASAPTGVDRLIALIPRKGVVNDIDTTVLLHALFPDDGAATALAQAISASTNAKSLAKSHGVWALVALDDTSTASGLDVTAATAALQARGKVTIDRSMLDTVAAAPAAAPGAWESAWFADLEVQRMRAFGLGGDPPPGAGSVSVDGTTSRISSVRLEVRFAVEGTADLPSEKRAVLTAIDSLATSLRASTSRTPADRLSACMAGYTRANPLRIVLSKLKPRAVFTDPVTALVFTSDADATNGDPARRVPAMRLPQAVIALGALDQVLAHELVHYHLMRRTVGTDALWATVQPGLALSGPRRVQRMAAWLAYFHLAAQEEIFTFDLVSSVFPPRPKIVTSFETFLKESRAAFKELGATLTNNTATIPGPRARWRFQRDVPSKLPTLRYADMKPLARALEKFPRAKT